MAILFIIILLYWYFFQIRHFHEAVSILRSIISIHIRNAVGPIIFQTLHRLFEDHLERPEDRMQNAYMISRDCDVTRRNVLETLKRTLIDHDCWIGEWQEALSSTFPSHRDTVLGLYALNRTLNDTSYLLQFYYDASGIVVKIETNAKKIDVTFR